MCAYIFYVTFVFGIGLISSFFFFGGYIEPESEEEGLVYVNFSQIIPGLSQKKYF